MARTVASIEKTNVCQVLLCVSGEARVVSVVRLPPEKTGFKYARQSLNT